MELPNPASHVANKCFMSRHSKQYLRRNRRRTDYQWQRIHLMTYFKQHKKIHVRDCWSLSSTAEFGSRTSCSRIIGTMFNPKSGISYISKTEVTILSVSSTHGCILRGRSSRWANISNCQNVVQLWRVNIASELARFATGRSKEETMQLVNLDEVSTR